MSHFRFGEASNDGASKAARCRSAVRGEERQGKRRERNRGIPTKVNYRAVAVGQYDTLLVSRCIADREGEEGC
eukprot:3633150-Rhodomonas_salina.1